MPFGTRMWGVGKFLVLAGALGITFLVFFGVGMRVALRSREVQVPKLIGSTVNEATQAAAALALALRVEDNRRADPKVPAGRIMQQDPPAGVESREQRTVRVWVSAGALTTVVPSLVGQTERSAQMRLSQDGLETEKLSEFRSPDYPTDSVVAQDPPPKAQAPGVSFLVNRGELATTYVMPDLIGMDGERAATVLRREGFRVSIVGSQPYPGVPPGIVVRQQPVGGFRISARDAVSLEVSR